MEKEEFLGAKGYAPFVREKTCELLVSLISQAKPQKVLEIGTFLGYSCARMLESGALKVITVEKDKTNAEFARENLKKFGDRVEVVNVDAIDFLKDCTTEFDFVFLDGPKGQYLHYLPYIKKLLKKGGYLVADDVMFYGHVDETKVKHKHRTIVVNLRKFLQELQSDEFETQIFKFENGVSVSKKRI